MNLFGQELSKREMLLLGATVAIGVLGGLVWIGRTSASSEIRPKEVLRSLQREEEEISRALKDAEKRRTDLGLGAFMLPDPEIDSPAVHLHIEKTARTSGLNFPSLSATAPKKGKGVLTIGYRFTATSELKNLVQFIDQIQTGKYLICLESWGMTPTDDPKIVRTDLALRAYFQPSSRR